MLSNSVRRSHKKYDKLVKPTITCRRISSPVSLKEKGIKLLVCDMAGTVVDEGGIVYKSLMKAMNKFELNVKEDEMHPWHGAKKSEVISHFVTSRGRHNEIVPVIEEEFLEIIETSYFGENACISLIHPTLLEYLAKLRANGIKVGLNTGYPRRIQDGLLDNLKLRQQVDAYVSSQDVPFGRPSPFMVFRLMEKTNVQDVRKVAKVGDSINDMLEGRNSGCGLVIGVESGVDSKQDLLDAGADFVVGNVTDVRLE